MHPELWSSGDAGLIVQSYGVMLAAGLLSGLYLAMRRCILVKCDPDPFVTLGLIAIIVGLGGARIFFVIHYWDDYFAAAPNRLRAILDLRSGGLEYLGGLVPAIVAALAYFRWKRLSIRLYADIVAVMIAWMLGLGRIGCFLNGCCHGGACVDPSGNATTPLAVQFQFGSWASIDQWERRETTLPAELLVDGFNADTASPIAQAGPLGREVTLLTSKTVADYQRDSAGKPVLTRRVAPVLAAREYPSRVDPSRRSTFGEIRGLATRHPALWSHPTQLYSAAAALLLSNLLARVFHRRKRHGMVFGLLMLTYPPVRFVLETIRTDNPLDTFGMTVSQAVSVGMVVVGVVWMLVIYRLMPERSPAAVAHEREPRIYDRLFPV